MAWCGHSLPPPLLLLLPPPPLPSLLLLPPPQLPSLLLIVPPPPALPLATACPCRLETLGRQGSSSPWAPSWHRLWGGAGRARSTSIRWLWLEGCGGGGAHGQNRPVGWGGEDGGGSWMQDSLERGELGAPAYPAARPGRMEGGGGPRIGGPASNHQPPTSNQPTHTHTPPSPPPSSPPATTLLPPLPQL